MSSRGTAARWATTQGAAKRAGLFQCSRKKTRVYVHGGTGASRSPGTVHAAQICKDPNSETGATAVFKIRGTDQIVMVPFGKRNNPKARAVPLPTNRKRR